MSGMDITKAEIVVDHGYPILRFVIGGHAAFVIEPKRTLLDAGLVVLLDQDRHWEDTLAEVFEADGRRIPIPGATRDPQILALVRRFVGGEEGNLLLEP